MNSTTQRFTRTSRGSGTEYAASIERTRRTDVSGIAIVLICMALVGVVWSLT